MEAVPTASRCLVRIADLLFSQIKSFGQLSQSHKQHAWSDNSDIVGRFAFTRSYLQLLEQTSDLRFRDGEIPILYYNQDWPSNLPIAGYTGPNKILKPSEALLSYLTHWDFSQLNHSKKGNTTGRIVRAALFVLSEQDFISAIEYVLDLELSGLIINSKDTYTAITSLCAAYVRSRSKGELIEFFLGETPVTAKDWLDSSYAAEDPHNDIHRELPPELLNRLIERGLDLVESVREASSYDEWIIGQSGLSDSLVVINAVIRQYDNIPPTIQAIRDQFEEIAADAGAMMDTWPIYNGGLPMNANWNPANGLAALLKSIDSDGWQDRLIDERCVVPRALASSFFNGDRAPGSNWQGVSPTLSPIVNYIVLDASSDRPWRSRHFTVEDIRQSSVALRLLRSAGDEDPQILDALIRSVVGEDIVFQSAFKGLIKHDYQSNTRVDDYVVDWFRSNEDVVKNLVSRCRSAVLNEEITKSLNETESLENQARYDEQLRALSRFVSDYPTFYYGHFELGVVYERLGSYDEALKHLVLGISGNPVNPEQWRSLGVTLLHSGHNDEAMLALAIREMIINRDESQVNL